MKPENKKNLLLIQNIVEKVQIYWLNLESVWRGRNKLQYYQRYYTDDKFQMTETSGKT